MNGMSCIICKITYFNHDYIRMGMNLPNITDGPQYFCKKCIPQKSAEELIKLFENFIEPPKEPSYD